MHNLKQKIVRDKKHLRFVASLPCCSCRLGGHSQAAHIGILGKGIKAPDSESVPLCTIHTSSTGLLVNGCHEVQTKQGHAKFWIPFGGVDSAKKLAADLYAVTGNWSKGCEIICNFGRNKA